MQLSALSGTPFDDVPTQQFVLQCGLELSAEQRIRVFDFQFKRDSITFVVEGDQVVALGFATELRTRTNAWYEQRYRDGPLWGTPRPA
jgi:hypothetical protein